MPLWRGVSDERVPAPSPAPGVEPGAPTSIVATGIQAYEPNTSHAGVMRPAQVELEAGGVALARQQVLRRGAVGSRGCAR